MACKSKTPEFDSSGPSGGSAKKGKAGKVAKAVAKQKKIVAQMMVEAP